MPAKKILGIMKTERNVKSAMLCEVSLHLIGATEGSNVNGFKGKIEEASKPKKWTGSLTGLVVEETYEFDFDWDYEIGVPGAVIVWNSHEFDFFLKTITICINGIAGLDIVFSCNSWVYPKDKYSYERVFFLNKAQLPSEMPATLRYHREQELVNLRGNRMKQLENHERVYDYDVYNDLGDPDSGFEYARQTLGGSKEFPYPRRGRTSRPPTNKDLKCESVVVEFGTFPYVPRDEQCGDVKKLDILTFGMKKSILQSCFDEPKEINSFEELHNLYENGLEVPKEVLDKMTEKLKNHLDGNNYLKFPTPHVIQNDKNAWDTDEEFARETVAGVNPGVIRRLENFPPISKLDHQKYGDHTSKITKHHIEKNLEGMDVDKAREKNRLYIVDYHDTFMPYLIRINETNTKIYATRTLFFLRDDGTLKPVAIELSLPHESGRGSDSEVITPAIGGLRGIRWKLAKAYATINDSGFHQLVSHWLNTHAVVEPFVIAANRQLSMVHPIYKLLQPHFRDTMFINAAARHFLINAGGIFEQTVFMGKYAMEMSAVIYKSWNFTEQGLPVDLLKRGVAVKDPAAQLGIRLLIKDYPYAVDGLEIWSAIYAWVEVYCAFYYKCDNDVLKDTELQAFWKELREVGHGDLKDEPWWPKMHTRQELVDSCATLIWIASALHAAVNFGQYSYAGFLPNRPTMSRRFLPKQGTPEYDELRTNPNKAYFQTISSELVGILGVSIVEILSKHSTDEVYLGQRDETWTAEVGPIKMFEKFNKALAQVEDNIMRRNNDANLKNRAGAVKFPYSLLLPSSKEGLTARGIPNSISM